MVAEFESCTLSKEEWTHEAHLIVGLHHLDKYSDKAVDQLREQICKYNIASGGTNTDSSGYHETMTRFWNWAIYKYCQVNGKVIFDQTTLDDMLWTEELSDRNLWTAYYSKELMLSVRARLEWVLPDLKPLN